jgi:hypothetical protein
MPADIGVLIVHGMGAQEEDFADGFVAEMRGRLLRLGVAAERVAWRAGWWADVVRDREDALWGALSREHTLRWGDIRRFVVSHFGDAIAYQRVPSQGSDVYRLIHARLRAHLAALRAQMGADRPIVVIAHSLGSVIVSNYTWDEQKAPTAGTSATEQMRTLAGLVTFGSNIPLFTLYLDEIVPIDFPAPELSPAIRRAARWLNFFDADDVLGWPLRPLSARYAEVVSADHQINVGSVLHAWNPLSHEDYWTDDDFTGPVAALLRDLLAAVDESAPAPDVMA